MVVISLQEVFGVSINNFEFVLIMSLINKKEKLFTVKELSNILLRGVWWYIYLENLLNFPFCTAIMIEIFVESRSSLSILIPFKITSK